MTKLKEFRKLRRLKLRELGERLGITPQTVYQQETTGIKTIRVAKRYAKVLGCSPLDLMDF